MLVSDVQLKNNPFLMVVIELGKVMLERSVQFLKVYDPIVVTELGIVMLVSEEHPSNA